VLLLLSQAQDQPTRFPMKLSDRRSRVARACVCVCLRLCVCVCVLSAYTVCKLFHYQSETGSSTQNRLANWFATASQLLAKTIARDGPAIKARLSSPSGGGGKSKCSITVEAAATPNLHSYRARALAFRASLCPDTSSTS
jgi:hypothetical protein